MAQGLEKLFVVPESSNGGTAEEKILAPCREVLSHNYPCCGASWLAPVVKNPPANAGDIRDAVSIPGSGRSFGGGHTTHSSIPGWRIPWMEEPGRL